MDRRAWWAAVHGVAKSRARPTLLMAKRFYMDNLFIQTTIRRGEKVITPISETAQEEIRGRERLHGSESGLEPGSVRQQPTPGHPRGPSQVGRSGLGPRPAPPGARCPPRAPNYGRLPVPRGQGLEGVVPPGAVEARLKRSKDGLSHWPGQTPRRGHLSFFFFYEKSRDPRGPQEPTLRMPASSRKWRPQEVPQTLATASLTWDDRRDAKPTR